MFPEGTEITTVDAPGARMRAAIHGAGPEVVWIPGGDAAADYWVEQWERLPGFRHVCYDPRGVGGTEAGPPPWTIGDYADDCAALIGALCAPPVIVAGLSMGGLIAQEVACRHPGLVRLAVPMGTAARIEGFTRDWMRAEIDMRRAGGPPPPVEFLTCHYAAFAYPAAALADPDVWARVKAAYAPRFGERDPAMLVAQWEACLAYDGRDALARCEVPMEVVAFAEDVQTPPAMVRQVAEIAPRARLHEMPGLGHVSFARHAPDAVADLLRGLLEGAP